MALHYVKFFRGTYENYEKVLHKDPDTLYFVYTDPRASTGQLYLGEQLISGGIISEGQLNINLEGLSDGDLLVYNQEAGEWQCRALDDLIPELTTIQIFEQTVTQDKTADDLLEELSSGKVLHKGDIAIVRELIADGQYSRTSYIYNGQTWKALTGKTSATDVLLKQDLYTTDAAGNVQHLEAGTPIEDGLRTLLNGSEESPVVTQPSAKLIVDKAGAYEVGTKVQVGWKVEFDKGNYQFGPDTAVSASYTIGNSENEDSSTEQSGTFTTLVDVNDETNFVVNADVAYTDGAIPIDQYGKLVAEKQIKASTIQLTSKPITGYRACFYGSLADKAVELTSSAIRELKSANIEAMKFYPISIPIGSKRVVIAVPGEKFGLSKVLDRNAGHVDITGCFVRQIVQVNGANGANAVSYNVYVMDRAEANKKENEYMFQVKGV